MWNIDETELEDLEREIKKLGYQPTDFRVNNMDFTNWSRLKDIPLVQRVAVTCISTDIHRVYPAGDNTHWVDDCVNELKNKLFDK